MEGDTIVVADGAPRVLVFTPEGSVARTLGREGEAPGEYRDIDWIARIPPDTFLVYDPRLRRLSYVHDHGEIGRVVTVREAPESRTVPELLGVFEDGSLLASQILPPDVPRPLPESFTVRPRVRLMLYDGDGAFVKDLVTASGPELAYLNGVRVSMEFDRSTLFEVGDAEFYVTPAESFAATVIDQSGDTVRVIERDHVPVPVTESDLERREAPDGSPFPRPDFFPAISDVIVDATDHLWIRPFTREGTGPVRWSVFAPDGRLLGTVDLPRRFEPTDIGEDYVLGVSRDELDIETVKLHDLTRSPR